MCVCLRCLACILASIDSICKCDSDSNDVLVLFLSLCLLSWWRLSEDVRRNIFVPDCKAALSNTPYSMCMSVGMRGCLWGIYSWLNLNGKLFCFVYVRYKASPFCRSTTGVDTIWWFCVCFSFEVLKWWYFFLYIVKLRTTDLVRADIVQRVSLDANLSQLPTKKTAIAIKKILCGPKSLSHHLFTPPQRDVCKTVDRTPQNSKWTWTLVHTITTHSTAWTPHYR